MRVTSSMYYQSLYGSNSKQLQSRLFDVNKQIASGLQIQYASDDIETFSNTMRLDNEISALQQVQKSTESGYKVSNQTDGVLNEFTTSLDRVRTLILQASNASQSNSSMDAIAAELRGVESHFKNLANTSINGRYLFSGSTVDTKPIADDGTYMGNDQSMQSFLGSGVKQDYNLTGAELFLGEESLIKRRVTTNVPQYSLTEKYPDFSDPTVSGIEKTITTQSTIYDLMGDLDTDPSNGYGSHFYIQGAQSDGKSFTSHIKMDQTDTVNDLLINIGNAFGNTPALNVVNVTLNQYGEILVEDKINGSSKLDFHMVGATDYDASDGTDAGDINSALYGVNAGQLSNLSEGETNFDLLINGISEATNKNLHVKNFILSSPAKEISQATYSMDRAVAASDILSLSVTDRDGVITSYNQAFTVDPATTYAALEASIEADGNFLVSVSGDDITLNVTQQGTANGIYINTPLANNDASGTGAVTVTATVENDLLHDKMHFSKNGAILSSSVPQILSDGNAFAGPSTKLSEVADLSKGITGSIDGTTLSFSGLDITGTPYDVRINLNSAGSTFSFDTDNNGVYDDPEYNIYNMDSTRVAVDADEMTYRQLMDVINMVVSNTLPASGTASTALEYDQAVSSSSFISNTTLTYDGKIEFGQLNTSSTKASISLHDLNSGDFTANAPVMTFNSNNALTINDPKTDFFKSLDEVISAIEEHKLYPDGTTSIRRNIGMENSVSVIDDLQIHLSRSHATVGANSNTLETSLERTSLLEISTMTLRSSIIDTDLAEASLTLTQLSLNYEAMLSTVGKVSKLSLVNYL